MREIKKVLGWGFMIAILLVLAGFAFNLQFLMYVSMTVALPGIAFLLVTILFYAGNSLYKKIKNKL